tara:strand:+ start:853 stop:1536 length:684 start_codon:yes stop_codon:yes gene_type:complete
MSDENVTKSNEGVNLALQAVAEVLRKMDERLEKQEAEELKKSELAQEDTQKVELANMIKGIVSKAISEFRKADKEDDDQDEEDLEKIIEEIEDEEEEVEKQDKEEEELDFKEKDMDKGYKKSQADEISFLKNQMEELQKGIDEKIEKEATTRLRQLGFREESGLQAPELIKYDSTIGVDEETPIKKSDDNGDVIEQLSKLSYRELRNLQYKIQIGDTNGVPKELLKQ